MGSIALRPIERDAYRLLSEENSLPLYGQLYWLEAAVGASGRAWRFFVLQKGEELLALAACFTPIEGVWILPPCCQSGTIYFVAGESSFQDRRRAMELLAQEMRCAHFVRITLPEVSKDALPFYWQGYDLKLRYNYRLALPSEETTYDSMVSRIVKRKANQSMQSGCRVAFDVPFAELEPFFGAFYRKKGIAPIFFQAMCRCALESERRGSGMTAVMRDASDKLLAAYFIPICGQVGYSMATATVEGNPFANTALLYYSIKELIQRGGKEFDFEGSMLEGVEPIFRSLGGEQHLLVSLEKGHLSWRERFLLKRALMKHDPS